MKKIFIVLLFLAFTSCATVENKSRFYVFDYTDFGPQAIAHDLLGMAWWQWQNHGDSRPRKYNIKVVVYRNMTLQQLKQQYPVVPEKNKDYRYVEYKSAVEYLDQHINENVFPQLSHSLKQTRLKIIKFVGE